MADNKTLPSSGIVTPQQSQQNQPKKKGTGFTNLSRILQASQGSKLGQTIAGGITGQAQQVQSGVKSAQEQFKKESEANRLGTSEQAAQARNIIETAASTGNLGSAASTGNLGSSDVGTFQNYLSGQYKGPTELANRQQLTAQAQQAETLGRLASGIGSRSGTNQGDRQELLRRFAGGADYTSGQRKLDESILAKDKEANLAAAARQTRGVAEEAQRAGTIAQSQAQEYQNVAKQFAKETRQKIQEAQIPITSQISEQLTKIKDFEKQKQDYLTNLNRELQTTDWANKKQEDKKTAFLNYLNQAKGFIPDEQFQKIQGDFGLLKTSDFLNKLSDLDKKYNIDSMFKPAGISIDDVVKSNREKEQFLQMKNELNPYKNLDYSELLKTFQDVKPLNVTESGVATEDQSKRLTALDRLLQKTGTDLIYSPDRQLYQAGGIQSDVSGKTEPALKGAADYSNKIRDYASADFDKKIKDAKYWLGQTSGMYPAEKTQHIKDWTNKLNQLQSQKNQMLKETSEASDYAKKAYDDFIAKRDAAIRQGKM